MTRNDHRAKCIKAMAIAWLRTRGYKSIDGIPDWMMRQTIEEQTAAFDSLRSADVRVVPLTAIEDDVTRVAKAIFSDCGYQDEIEFVLGDWEPAARSAITAMRAAGDLTNPPEAKS